MRGIGSACRVVLLVALAGGGLAGPAEAAFPGQAGRVAFEASRDGASGIFSVHPFGGDERFVTAGELPAWSPDGDRLAFVRGSEIYVSNADGSGESRLTNNASLDTEPAWSADGQRIAFVTDRDGNREIYVMNANGSDPSNLTTSAVNEQQPAWSPQGDELAFASEGSIYVAPVDAPGRRLLTTGSSPNWSPDGSKLAFDDPGALSCEQIHVINADGSVRTQLTSGFCDGGVATSNTDPVWSPEGRQGEGEDAVEEIAFVSSTCSFRGCELPEIEVLNTVSQLSRFLAQGTGHDWQPIPPNRPPECSGVRATPNVLAPANHKLVQVTLVGATDPDGDAVNIQVTGVTQDEPAGGSPDAVLGPGDDQVRLRAERDPHGDGRLYTVAFTVGDGRGGSCSGTTTVSVPRRG